MFDTLKEPPADKIIMLMQMFRDDPRADKIDLGVGVYKDAQGRTPVMRAVRAAEQRVWQDETTKTYTALTGDPAFLQAMRRLILDQAVTDERVAAAATPGGTGALRLALELVRLARPDATVWVSAPTWPNHLAIIGYLGLKLREYRYFDAATGGIDLDGMLADIGGAAAGDVILLHGCCHNPTGANPAPPPTGTGSSRRSPIPARCRWSIWPIRASATGWMPMPPPRARSPPACPRR